MIGSYAILCSCSLMASLQPDSAEWCGTDNAAGSWWLQPGYHLSFMEENPPYPFQRIKHVDGKDTGVMAIIAPFYDLDYYKVTIAIAFFS